MSTVKIEDIKREGECCCCFSKVDLFSMLVPYNFEENAKNYSVMIADCFRIELSSYIEECDRNLYMICRICVFHLKGAIMFRSQIRTAYDRLQAECCMKRDDISSKCSNLIDTKYHILKNDISDYDNKKGIKREGECCCCFSKEDLFSMLEPYNFEENVEIYSTMIADCFQIELSSCIEDGVRNRYLICKNCVFRLRDAIMFRSQIQIVYNRLQAECCTKKDDHDDVSSKYSNLIDTKEHILKYDILEYDNKEDKMDVYSGASVSNKNGFKLKFVKIVLEKIDNNTIENVSIVSTCNGSDARTQSSKIYFCNICNKLLRNVYAIQEHKRLHVDIKYYICDYCKRGLKHKSSLRAHILLHMGIKNFKCNSCDKYFVSTSTLSSHNIKFHSVKRSCNICAKTFISKRTLDDHVLTHSGVKNQKCEVCEKTFSSRESLLQHKKLHFKENKKACLYCNKTFTRSSYLLTHEKMHLHIRDLICDYCNRKFRDRGCLKDHILLHMGVKNIKCDLCDKRFVSRAMFLKHKRTSHSANLYCNICKKTFHSKLTLESHALKHTGLNNPKCGICDKTFETKCTLNKHKILHTNKKTCRYCNKAFTDNRDLLRHEKIHTDSKDFICDYCKKGFIDKSNFNEHILLHMGVKKFKCDLCNKWYVSKRILLRHKKKIHSVRLSCNICNEIFNSKRSFENHTLIHSNLKCLKCEICDKIFQKRYMLNRHKKIHQRTSESSFIGTSEDTCIQ